MHFVDLYFCFFRQANDILVKSHDLCLGFFADANLIALADFLIHLDLGPFLPAGRFNLRLSVEVGDIGRFFLQRISRCRRLLCFNLFFRFFFARRRLRYGWRWFAGDLGRGLGGYWRNRFWFVGLLSFDHAQARKIQLLTGINQVDIFQAGVV